MSELALDSRTVVWGHSQGGHSALWSGIIGPRYAPEIEIAGMAAIARGQGQNPRDEPAGR